MHGKIVKGIGGFYYVTCGEILYECKAKGLFRKDKVKPLVGDDVKIEVLDEGECIGNISEILPRKTQLIRPAVANVDQALVIFAAAVPEPNLNLLDRFILMMGMQGIETVICFNKLDIVSDEKIRGLLEVYRKCGNKVLAVSSKNKIGMDKLFSALEGKTTVLAGPSGVGKSSLVNDIYPKAKMETGAVSEKIHRGKHTTRHSELFCIYKDTYIMDTPGFSTLEVPDVEKEELKEYFTEFLKFEEKCKFGRCMHIHEPGCEVKRQIENGVISEKRYENYLQIYKELKERKKY